MLNLAKFEVAVPANHRPGEVATGSGDSARHFTAVSYTPLESRADFISRINAGLEKLPPENREIFIFVHGYNNTISESLFRTAQIVTDFGIRSVPLHYAWPSAASVPLYVYDRDSSIAARDGLARTIEMAAETKARDIVLVAHSMGAFVVMEALRTLAMTGKGEIFGRLGGVVLAAPDIDVDVFESQANDIGTLPRPFTILVSRRDRAIGFSRFLAGGHPRIGNATDIGFLQEKGVTVIDVSDVDGGGHTVFASSEVMRKLVENSRLTRDTLRNEEGVTSPLNLASAAAATVTTLPLTIFLPTGSGPSGRQFQQ